MRRVTLFASVLLLTLTVSAFGQGEQSGAIHGRLSTSDGLALPGATVTVVSPSLQGMRTTVADVNGVYTIPGLPPGDYTVRFEMAGLAAADRRITVPFGSPLVVDQTFVPATVTETINVTAEPLTPVAAPAGAFNLRTDLTKLPVGCTPFPRRQPAPGVTDNTPNQNQLTIRRPAPTTTCSLTAST